MTVCHYCRQDIRDTTGCDVQALYRPGGRVYARIPFGDETAEPIGSEREDRCPNCRVAHGMVHHPGCVTEQCPRCHSRLTGCHCRLVVMDRPAEAESPSHARASPPSVLAGQKAEERRDRPAMALPAWRPTPEQSNDLLATLRLGQLAGCWQRPDCRLKIGGGYVHHECGGETELIPIAPDVDIVARLKARHASSGA